MKKLVLTILGIIFTNALFAAMPAVNASLKPNILMIYQFFINALFVFYFILKPNVVFPEKERQFMTDIKSGIKTLEEKISKL
jgi:hypothetical protein